MKKFIVFIIGLVIIFIQTFFINYFSRFINVNLLLIFVVLYSLYLGKNTSIVMSGILGLISGIVGGGIVGLDAILLMVVAYFISVVEKSIFKDNRQIVCLLVLVVSFVYTLICAVVSIIFFVPPTLIIGLLKVILIPLINTVFAFVGYTIFEERIKGLKEE